LPEGLFLPVGELPLCEHALCLGFLLFCQGIPAFQYVLYVLRAESCFVLFSIPELL
jgi:hypothetical protein